MVPHVFSLMLRNTSMCPLFYVCKNRVSSGDFAWIIFGLFNGNIFVSFLM